VLHTDKVKVAFLIANPIYVEYGCFQGNDNSYRLFRKIIRFVGTLGGVKERKSE